jgi:hypothetical protein
MAVRISALRARKISVTQTAIWIILAVETQRFLLLGWLKPCRQNGEHLYRLSSGFIGANLRSDIQRGRPVFFNLVVAFARCGACGAPDCFSSYFEQHHWQCSGFETDSAVYQRKESVTWLVRGCEIASWIIIIIMSHVRVAIDGVRIGDSIYWPLIHTTRNYK